MFSYSASMDMSAEDCEMKTARITCCVVRDNIVNVFRQLYSTLPTRGRATESRPIVLYRGWCQKRSEHIGRWNDRYIVVRADNGDLAYYDDDRAADDVTSATPRRVVSLVNATVTCVGGDGPEAGSSGSHKHNPPASFVVRVDLAGGAGQGTKPLLFRTHSAEQHDDLALALLVGRDANQAVHPDVELVHWQRGRQLFTAVPSPTRKASATSTSRCTFAPACSA
jgi:hypothetical protein